MEKVHELLQGIMVRQDLFAKQMEQVLDKICETEVTTQKTEDKFLACARSFHQVKEAVECLLEAIDSYGGVITAQTWNDGDGWEGNVNK